MTTLKELTHDNHELAEAHPFTKLLLSGSIPENVYADFYTISKQFIIPLKPWLKEKAY